MGKRRIADQDFQNKSLSFLSYIEHKAIVSL